MDGIVEYPLIKPDDLVREAWAAMGGSDPDAALRLWQAVREDAPERPEGHIWPIQLLWRSGRLDAAEAMAAAAAARFPDHPELFVQRAWIATARQRWAEAAQRWAAVRRHAPERLEGYVWGARALWQAGDSAAADAVACDGLARFPHDPQILAEYAWAATARQEWAEALRRWRRAHEVDPERFDAPTKIAEALRGLGRPEEAEALAVGSATAATDNDLAPDALMLKFESIGERCDFGAVQRHFGAEPLGLLRFAWCRLDPLLAALADRFAAVGTVEDTRFERYGDETILRMTKYGLIFHTFVYGIDDEPADRREAFYERQRRRLRFLKDKLIGDLERPEKIFVYSTGDTASDDDAARLFAALRVFGNNTLLFVRPARSGRAAGTVEMLRDGLIAGYYPGLTNFVAGDQPPFALWRQLCAQAYRLAAAPRTSGRGPATSDTKAGAPCN